MELEVKVLIQAPVGYICEECVAICASMIAKDAATTSPTPETPERSLEIFDAGFAPIAGTDDNEGEDRTAMKPGDTVRFVRNGEWYMATIISFAPRVFGGAGFNVETTKGWVLRDDIEEWTPAAALNQVEGEEK